MSRFGWFLGVSLLSSALAASAADSFLVCSIAAAPQQVRAEGLAERMGDITLTCSGGTPGLVVNESLYVFLSVPITNRVSSTGVVDAILTADTGSGPASSGAVASLIGAGIGFNGIQVTVPASGIIAFTISNLRGAVAQQDVSNSPPIVATFGTGGDQLSLLQGQVTVGIPARGMGADFVSGTFSACYGSPLPATVTMSNLIAAGTGSNTMRVTEGFVGAFRKRGVGDDSGLRIVLNYSGFRSDAMLFVPDVVAGSDATVPTSAGALALAASGGSYTPGGSGSLLLARVAGADSQGAGGAPVYTPGAPGSGAVTLDGATAVPLVNGAAEVVYEVVDSDPVAYARESAEIPTFVGLAPSSDYSPLGDETVTLGPLSTVAQPTQTDPVPRFISARPPADCVLHGDCGSFPTLVLNTAPLQFTAEAGSANQGASITVSNGGGGALDFTVSVSYQSGSGWLSVYTEATGNVGLSVLPGNLVPGVYQATLTFDAGPYAGSQALPVTLTVIPPITGPRINSIANAATYAAGAQAPGSLVMIKGAKLAGTAVLVTFDGILAKLLYLSDIQINLQVPPQLGSQPSTQVVVNVDGTLSAPFTLALTPLNPGIFPTGVLNQNSTVNSATNPAVIGSIISVYATGLPSNGSAISANLRGSDVSPLQYAGSAPGLIGMEQVNIPISSSFVPMTADLVLCGLDPTSGRKVCSPPVQVTMH